MDIKKESLRLHEQLRGKLSIVSKKPLDSKEALSLMYTPGVAEPCLEIAKDPSAVYRYTMKGNTVAVITDGSAVLGLGNIGPAAALPVMEGKAAIFKEFANIDAFPICLSTQDPDEIIKTVRYLAPVFGGINLEDIKAPECFYIEKALQDIGIPVMHDDQHGTAVVVVAAVINALKVVGKTLESSRVVVNGAGAAGIASLKLLLSAGLNPQNALMLDRSGIIYDGRDDIVKNEAKRAIAALVNPQKKSGDLNEAIVGADIFIGLSSKDALSKKMVQLMSAGAIVIAMANPDPEILPEDAKAAGAAVVATGRSDFANQVNNALIFPGVFRGALDARASRITESMKLAAAYALAGLIENPTADEIVPYVTDKKVVPVIAEAVKQAWANELS